MRRKNLLWNKRSAYLTVASATQQMTKNPQSWAPHLDYFPFSCWIPTVNQLKWRRQLEVRFLPEFLPLIQEKHSCTSRMSSCVLIPNLSLDLYLAHIALEITELLVDKYLLPSLVTPQILVRIIATGEGHMWWPSILTKWTGSSFWDLLGRLWENWPLGRKKWLRTAEATPAKSALSWKKTEK